MGGGSVTTLTAQNEAINHEPREIGKAALSRASGPSYGHAAFRHS